MPNQVPDNRRSQSGRIPQRVENAAQSMNPYASSGPRRGYVPGAYQPLNGAQMQSGNGQTGKRPMAGYNGNPPQNQSASGYNNTRQGQQAAGFNNNQQSQPYGYYSNGQSPITGGQRGFIMTSPAPQQPKPKKKKRSPVFAVIALLILLGALGTGGYFAVTSYQHTKLINDTIEPYDNLFCPGVYVDGIHLGGMTTEQAMNSVQSQIRQRHDAWKVQLIYNGTVAAEINADMLGLNVDPAKELNDAWKQGHTGDNEQRYEAMMRLAQEPYKAYTAKPEGNTQVIDDKLAQIKSAIDQEPVNAEMVEFNPELSEPFIFRDEAYGYRLDTEKIKEQLYQMVSTLQSGTVNLEPDRIEPAVRKADLMKYYTRRSSVTTPIDKRSPEDRNKNIRKAMEIVNGYILEPGKSFSFNGVVGERTEANGFYPAIEYVSGEEVVGYGGGVCQASTTLYQAAVRAGLQIVKREPHSDRVSYAEYGKDATVYWVGKRKIDLVFKNNTDSAIYIVAGVQEDPSNKKRLITKVSMYGLDLGDIHYDIETETLETLLPPFEPEYKKDTEGKYVTYRDQQKSVSKAREGYVVRSYRVEYTGNVITGRTELFTDRYEAKAEVIYYGAKDR